jgi:hypothetical protein
VIQDSIDQGEKNVNVLKQKKTMAPSCFIVFIPLNPNPAEPEPKENEQKYLPSCAELRR